jgi:hypothetical protein
MTNDTTPRRHARRGVQYRDDGGAAGTSALLVRTKQMRRFSLERAATGLPDFSDASG